MNRSSGSSDDILVQEANSRGLKLIGPAAIWPAPYREDTPEFGLRFLTECCYTDNDADQTVELIPLKGYIAELVCEWHRCLTGRQDFILEKSRRMIASWVFRGLELWQAGLNRGNWLLCDQDYAQSAKHVWRYHWLLEQMRNRRPEMRLPAWESRGPLKARQLDMVVLANGSTLSNANQDAGDLQGEGKTAIVLEEFSRYRDPARFWAQAHFLTQGAARRAEAPERSTSAERSGSGTTPPVPARGTVTGPSREGSSTAAPGCSQGGTRRAGGWVCAICNASPNEDYRAIKGKVSRVSPERCEFQTDDAGEVVDHPSIDVDNRPGISLVATPGGARYVNLHYSADPEKDEDCALPHMKANRTMLVASKQKPTEARWVHVGFSEAHDERNEQGRARQSTFFGIQTGSKEEEDGDSG